MNIIAVIVSYESDPTRLEAILKRLTAQCSVVVADNSITMACSTAIAARSAQATYINMEGNKGIATAQNVAIAHAWAQGADAVLLLDDDSMPADDLVQRLVACSESLGDAAVVSATALDSRGRDVGNAPHARGPCPYCRNMMNSGTLIRRKIFERIGAFNEKLFIDCVDYDWGWRARQSGIALHLCRAAVIEHQLGDGSVLGLRYSSPIRHYYQYRNILHMMTCSYTPWSWRLSQLVKLPAKLLLICVLMPNKCRRLRFAFAGIRDAIMGRNGPWPGTRRSGAQGLFTP